VFKFYYLERLSIALQKEKPEPTTSWPASKQKELYPNPKFGIKERLY
jgi:hypothetical protein